ncbi:MAG: ACT domain-containing protein [Anaerolineae bacterium]|nr:ACT domain-containing protein [Anaerolineae bacterium]MDW8099998.1 ACT domain-containing protein [Anaerolineae bacterium]
MNESVRALLATTCLRVAADSFVLVRLPAAVDVTLLGQLDQAVANGFFSLTRAGDETSLFVPEAAWARLASSWPAAKVERGWRLITLQQTVALDVAGYLAPLAQALAASRVPVLVISAFSTDHLAVQEQDLPAALDALQQVIEVARKEQLGLSAI